jgi:hypothetical protein
MSLGYGIPAQRICWHHTPDGGTYELTDNHLAGFQERFVLTYWLAGRKISQHAYHSETTAREKFEKTVENHY